MLSNVLKYVNRAKNDRSSRDGEKAKFYVSS